MVEAPVISGNGARGAVDFPTLHLSAKILKAAGFDAETAARVLKEVYEVDVEPAEVERWYNTTPPEVEKYRSPSKFLQRLSRDKLWALRYAVGAAVGDGDDCGRLEVADWGFAYAYASAITTLTGAPVKVRRREGRYRVGCRFVGYIARSPLWKTVAFLDRLDERKHFLSGLLDAEGSIIPIVDRKRRNLRVRVQFVNTNLGLIEYVMDALKELGFKPNIKVVEPGDEHVKRDGEAVRRRRTLYKVYADINPSKITPLERVGFNCSRKKLLLEFFLSVRKLPPRRRYGEFTRCWTKIGDEWMPASLSTGRGGRHKTYIVKCPKCWKVGVFELCKEVIGGRLRIYVRVHHGSKVCQLEIVEKERPTTLINCPKCGELGYVSICTVHVKQGRFYKYLRVRVRHSRRRAICTLMNLRILGLWAQQPQPSPVHQ